MLYAACTTAEPGTGHDAKAAEWRTKLAEWRTKLAEWQATTRPATTQAGDR